MKRVNPFESELNQDIYQYKDQELHFDDINTDPHLVFSKLSDTGKGSFGIVSQIVYLPTMRLLAGKFLNPALINDTIKKDIFNDVNQMREIKSDNIIQYYGCVSFEESLLILMEYCEHGSLRDIMNEKQLGISEDQISIILFDLLNAIQHIHHEHKIIHRDIKASNLLLNSESKIKISDFILTSRFEFPSLQPTDSLLYQTIGIVGTPYWMAPEVISSSQYSFPSDIWSIGITAVELSEGSPPYIEYTPSKAMINIVKNGFPGYRFPDKHSTEFKDFVSHCVQMDPSLRWTCSSLLEHPFIQRAKKMNRKKVLEELIQIEIPHLKADLNLLNNNKNHGLYQNSNPSFINQNQLIINSIVASSASSLQNSDNNNRPLLNIPNSTNFMQSLSGLKLSPRLQSIIKNKRENDSPENSSDKYSDFIDNSVEMPKEEIDNMLDFISNGHEMNNQLEFIPFKIATNQNAEISSIYFKDRNLGQNNNCKKNIFNFCSILKNRLILKIITIIFLFFISYKFGLNITLLTSFILMLCYSLRYFVFKKK